MKDYTQIITEVETLEDTLHSVYRDIEFTEPRQSVDPYLCPRCGIGRLRLINGRYGPFYGCSIYPGCTYTRNI